MKSKPIDGVPWALKRTLINSKVNYEIKNFLEATIGFEPMNKSFADFPLKPLEYVADWTLNP